MNIEPFQNTLGTHNMMVVNRWRRKYFMGGVLEKFLNPHLAKKTFG
jgi:hypothetical protein